MYKMASLSEQGWISDNRTILANCISNYLNTDAAQSMLFSRNLVSLAQTYFQYINDPDGMASAISSDLNTILSAYFADVDVYAEPKKLTERHYAISLRVGVISEEGIRYDLARVMEIDTDSLRKIIELNNYGDATTTLAGY